MKIHIPAFADGAAIPAEHAFGVIHPETHVALSANRSPRVEWSELPAGTHSLALICHDPDVPSRPDDVNQEGRQVPYELPRADFHHWILVDVEPGGGAIEEALDSDGVTARGKALGRGPAGVRGRNDYTSWFDGDPDMEGVYAGYDGPCPPWNDERLHHYVFTLYALDVPSLGLTGNFGAAEVEMAMVGHVLDSARWVGTYTLNPKGARA